MNTLNNFEKLLIFIFFIFAFLFIFFCSIPNFKTELFFFIIFEVFIFQKDYQDAKNEINELKNKNLGSKASIRDLKSLEESVLINVFDYG